MSIAGEGRASRSRDRASPARAFCPQEVVVSAPPYNVFAPASISHKTWLEMTSPEFFPRALVSYQDLQGIRT